MHLDKLINKLDEVIERAEKGSSLTGDDRIVKSTGNIIRAFAVKIEYARSRGQRPQIPELNGDEVKDAAISLAKHGAAIKKAA